MDRVRTRAAQIFALLFCCLGVAWAQDTTVRRVNNLAPFAERLDADGAAFSWTIRNGAPTLSSAFGEHGRVEVIGLDCVRPNDARAPCAAFQFRFQRETAHEDHAQLVINEWDASQPWTDAYWDAGQATAVLEAGIRMNAGVTSAHLSALWARFLEELAPLFDARLEVAS